MFNKDFYPTPESVIDMMGIDCQDKIVLEPQAGKGDIVDYLKRFGAKDILVCELNKDLAEIVKTKAKFIGHDFLKITTEKISHVQLIIMNPPFSKGDKHLLHAWEIAPEGCEIISLINSSNLENDYTHKRKELIRVIEDYGTETNLGNVFSQSERKTQVSISLVKLYKPNNNSENEFEGFFMDEDPVEQQSNSIMPFNAVRDVVQRYVYSTKCFEKFEILKYEMDTLNSIFDIGSITFNVSYNETATTKEDYKKALQKSAWKYLFDKMNIDRFVTSGVMKDINKFVESQQKIPFTMKNIYRMFDVILGTREESFNKSLIEAVENFTKHTHENRYQVEGWKTNEYHLLGKKIIMPHGVQVSYGGKMSSYRSHYFDSLNDLVKILCVNEGVNYDQVERLDYFINGSHGRKGTQYEDLEYLEFGQWYNTTFFEFRAYKKGTIHLKFKNEKVWANVNRRYGKLKGMVLPEEIK